MISVNSMVLNEPMAFFSLVSVANFVDEVMVVDTGSEQCYLDGLYLAQELCGNIDLYERKVPNAHSWKRIGNETTDVNEESGKLLGDVRRWMHNNSRNPIVFIVDGDEIYNLKSINYITNVLCPTLNKSTTLECGYIPFIDLLDSINVRQYHDMGRCFVKDKTFVHQNYPSEMHYSKTLNYCLLPYDNIRVVMTDINNNYCYHYEHLIKPHRKPPTNIGKFNLPQPEVFSKYQDLVKEKLPMTYEFMVKNKLYIY